MCRFAPLHRKRTEMRSQSGFTLVEVIATLVLAAILAAMVGLGVVPAIETYVSATENAAVAQRMQMTVGRLSREFMEISAVTSGPALPVTYQGVNGTHTVDYAAGGITLDGDLLASGVSAFTLAYLDAGGGPWTTADPIAELYEIVLTVGFQHPDVGPITITTSVNPRNNGTANGPV